MVIEVLWDDSRGAEDSEEMAAMVAGATSSEGVRKLSSFKGSVSSVEETRRLESVGDGSGFTETGVPW